jgi:formiminotetrahydrofolate cyclodeaminase
MESINSSPSPATADMTLGAFSNALAAKTSTPGGGGAAAITGSQAAALLSMVINFTLGHKKYLEFEPIMQAYFQQSELLRHELLVLADRDVEAFNGVAACYSMAKTTETEKAARTAALQAALKIATQTPFITAEKCLTILQLVEPIARNGNANVVSDAGVALYLADAALHSALINVSINLKLIKDEAFVAEWAAKRDQLFRDAATAQAAGKAACAATLGVPL